MTTTLSPGDEPDLPPKLPPKQAYSDYSSLPLYDGGPNLPKKLSLQLGASPLRDRVRKHPNILVETLWVEWNE